MPDINKFISLLDPYCYNNNHVSPVRMRIPILHPVSMPPRPPPSHHYQRPVEPKKFQKVLVPVLTPLRIETDRCIMGSIIYCHVVTVILCCVWTVVRTPRHHPPLPPPLQGYRWTTTRRMRSINLPPPPHLYRLIPMLRYQLHYC